MAAPGNDERVPADEPIIEFTRLLDAPRALVWEAWTDPKQVSQWWGPNGFSVTTHSAKIAPGGVWDFVMHGLDGRDYENRITYHEVVAPERLVYSHGEPGDADQFHVTVTFTEEAGKTRLVMHSRFPSLAARDRVAREFGAIEGGRQHLGNLADYLRRRHSPNAWKGHAMDMNPVKAGTTLTLVRMLDAPRELVFEVWVDAKHFQAWWGPAGSDNGETRLDVRPGGEIFVHMRGPGFDHPMGGEFLEIDAPNRLVFLSKAFKNPDGSWQFVNRNTVTFEDAGKGKTKMTLHCVVQQASEQMLVPVGGMEMGWSGSLDRLADLLTRL